MTGHKLLTVEPYRLDEAGRDRLVPTGRTFVVVDTLGAGINELVLICQGSSARLTPETDTPRRTPLGCLRDRPRLHALIVGAAPMQSPRAVEMPLRRRACRR